MSTETEVVQRVEDYFRKKHWKTRREVRLRGRMADIMLVKGKDIAVVEVKGLKGNVEKGIMQALHYKSAVNFSYLAINKEAATRKIKETCKNLGIGLIVVNGGIKEIIKPQRTPALQSVQERIFETKTETQEKDVELKSMLDVILRTKSQILILKLLFLNPTKEFHLSDIARKTDLTTPAVSKELSNLLRINLVTRREQGNLIFYRINKDSIIFDEMKRIFLKYEMFSELVTEQLSKEKDIRYALIYGSFAKGIEKEGSDIDLLVIGDVKEDYLLKTIPKIEKEVGREINFVLWTEKEFREKAKKKTPLVREIVDNPVIMIVGDEDGFKRAAKERSG
ncbi:MAG: hypothetical protein GWN01_10230 [Nitrosopumilaceae archaeon]|nr:hypothetical protein [Nitrosopumilaceae archaeon]NIU01278.1 hypothetical protein [Nitrosopumilaceae archaeon]NIU87626.1 hypothetical protein [Nitrosopumilaceae archaeon]NIV66051.1 hypothetical protein [Nitrosopumilaceae archaeon]NIX61880.1 hypothetical protein [Nitrosopumilaceae archaeon]